LNQDNRPNNQRQGIPGKIKVIRPWEGTIEGERYHLVDLLEEYEKEKMAKSADAMAGGGLWHLPI